MLIQELKNIQNLTEGEQALAAYILEHHKKVLEMTARELAEACYVSASTVVRLCKKLGLENYSAFKVKLSKETTENYLSFSKVDFDTPFRKEASPAELVDSMADLAIASITGCRENFDYAAAQRIAKVLARHKYINIYGLGHSAHCAREFCEKMNHIGHFVTLFSDVSSQIYSVMASGKEEAAILVSYSGETTSIIGMAQLLRKRGVTTVVITGNRTAPLLQYADHRLFIDSREQLRLGDKTDYFGSLYVIHFLFDCLFAMIFSLNYDDNLAKERRSILARREDN